MTSRSRRLGSALLLFMAWAPACSDDVEIGENRALSTVTGGAGGTGGAAGSGPDASTECVPSSCASKTYQCGDCLDNDQDGFADAADSECLGPCDNTEDSYYGGLPGQNNTPCRQDCYFDHDSGAGNDDCFWSHRCDGLSIAPDYPPSADARCVHDSNEMVPGTLASCADLVTSQSDTCRTTCAPLTPNGCDCFGCCELPNGSGSYVWLGSTDNGVGSCDQAHVDDPTKCRPCTPVSGCFNPCDPCEVCAGRRAGDTSSCTDGGGGTGSGSQCATGVQACGREGQPLCGANQYCITGCCVTIPA